MDKQTTHSFYLRVGKPAWRWIATVLVASLLSLLVGCGSQKQYASGQKKLEKETAKVAYVKMDDVGGWVLVAPNDSVVAKVYTAPGSAVPDAFKNHYIRIVSEDSRKIGYANDKGQVVMEPCFLAASAFVGPVATVVPYSDVAAKASTDDTAVGQLTGEEQWGVIDKNGVFVRTPSYKRVWNDELSRYIFVSPVSSFWIEDDGEMHGF